MMWIKVDTTAEEDRYWIRRRYCFGCKRVRLFHYCDDCGRYFCPHCSGEWEKSEESDFREYIAHTKC